MDIYKIHAESLADLQTELGGDCPVIQWPAVNGASYKILPGSVEQNRPLRDGGFSHMFDFRCVMPARQFLTQAIPDAPTLSCKLANTVFIYLGQHYKVVSVTILAGATMIKIVANSANQNA